ncbi:TRAP transporter large permease [Puniceibacterium sp. IMCC21224]|uniref:TRAP transporter large permease n=1 Tax=Puniceibacterium sp. IMCC21224 TaxID=1618204 RepID=UPI00064E05F9|nr:TRAP transporter large permease [Puniceibacterium sp. IMCC21224]KMK64943.1 TRAP transporter, DctM subunit [Puniceibacterium sp. IMCC21224]
MIVLLLIFAAAITIGVPIAIGMGLAGASWILFFEGLEGSILIRRMYGILSSFPLLAIPLFSMIGLLAERSGMLPEMVKWLQMILGRVRGGVAYINVAASVIMGGVSGTAVSDVAALGRMEIRMMTQAGYSRPYAAALTAATAVIAPIIPPSVAMVIFGLAAGGISIGGLFVAGVIPGLLMGAGLAFMVWSTARAAGEEVLASRPAPRDVILQTLRILPFLLLPVIVVGGIVTGVFTITESAAIGTVYTMVVGLVVTRTLRLRDVYDAMVYSAIISSVVGLLMGTGAIVSWILTRNRVTLYLAEMIGNFTDQATVFLALVAVVLLVLGTVMEATALIIAAAPILVPIARQYGIDDFQFGLVFVLSCMVGMITPPVGILLYMTATIAEIPLEQVFRATLRYALSAMALIGLLILVPQLTTWLPDQFGF